MPELPEVEILKGGLTKYIRGLVIANVEVRNKKQFSGKVEEIRGAKVIGIRRFGKMLLIELSKGKSIAVHVKMTGRLIYRGKKQPKNLDIEEDLDNLPNKHTHVIFHFRNGDKLYFNDVRKFGWIKLVTTENLDTFGFVKNLGPEPFKDLTLGKLESLLAKTSRPVKTLLMDQKKIAGVGNIYANEALFCTGINPKRYANKIGKSEMKSLYECILKVLKEGMKYGGSSTDSYRDVLGRKGKYQEHYFIYDREGEPCKRKGCKGTVVKVKMGGRGTYYCSSCQR